MVFARVEKAMAEGKEMNVEVFEKEIAQWEWKWVNKRKDYAVAPTGNSISVSKQLYQKYRSQLQ